MCSAGPACFAIDHHSAGPADPDTASESVAKTRVMALLDFCDDIEDSLVVAFLYSEEVEMPVIAPAPYFDAKIFAFEILLSHCVS